VKTTTPRNVVKKFYQPVETGESNAEMDSIVPSELFVATVRITKWNVVYQFQSLVQAPWPKNHLSPICAHLDITNQEASSVMMEFVMKSNAVTTLSSLAETKTSNVQLDCTRREILLALLARTIKMNAVKLPLVNLEVQLATHDTSL
jgi:hypothetical protein